MLSDIAVEKLDPPAYHVFAFSETMDIYCSDNDLVPVANLTAIDDRVLVTSSLGGSFHLILAKPLNRDELKRLQAQLKDMKFYAGEITGEMDEATRTAVSLFAEYRGAKYQFKNAVITRNLLDKMNVLDND